MKEAIVEFPSSSSYSENNITGYVYFKQRTKTSPVIVEVYLKGLPYGIHGFHIHEYPIKQNYLNLMKIGKTPKDLCKTLGGHFNPYGTIHGSYKYDTTRHAGDLINNLYVNINQEVKVKFEDPLISLYENEPNCIINRSIVIHKDMDDEGLIGLSALSKISKQLNGKNCKDGKDGKDCNISNVLLLNEKDKLTKTELESLKTGNAGNRIACGNIEII